MEVQKKIDKYPYSKCSLWQSNFTPGQLHLRPRLVRLLVESHAPKNTGYVPAKLRFSSM